MTMKDESNILNSTTWSQILDLDSFIQHNITVQNEGKTLEFKDLCSKWGDECFQNDILELGEMLPGFEAGTSRIDYPASFSTTTYKVLLTGHFLGGLEFEPNSTTLVKSAKTMLLFYFLASQSSPEERKL